MSDRLTAWLRTIVPVLWSAVVAWLIVKIPGVGAFADQLNDLGAELLVPVVSGAVYAAFRWLEPHVPDWLSRILLGSARPPTYAPTGADGVPNITAIPD